MAKRVELVFGMEPGGFRRPILHCPLRKFGQLQSKGTFSETLSQTLDLQNFAVARRSPQHVVN